MVWMFVLLGVLAMEGSIGRSQNMSRVECLDGCGVGRMSLGGVATIGACCGQQDTATNGGAFIPDGGPCRSCDGFRRIRAEVQITQQPQPPVVGQDLTLTCSVSADELLQATGTLIFTLPNGTVIDMVDISSSTATIMYQLTPLQAQDITEPGMYVCNVTVFSPEFPGEGLQEFQSVNFQRVMQQLTILSRGDPVLGQMYTLVCSTNNTVDDLVWFAPDGLQIADGDQVRVGELLTDNGITSRTLTFTALVEEDAGDYTCRSESGIATQTLQIQTSTPMPPSSTLVQVITPPSPPEIGQPYTAMCRVQLPDSLPASVSLSWFDPMGNPIISRFLGPDETSLDLQIDSVTPSDSGEYVCMAVITSLLLDGPQTSNATFTLNLETGTEPPPNECVTGDNNCDENAMCIDLDRGFQCICNPGFSGSGQQCIDIDECSQRNNCSCDATCVNTNGSYQCICNSGFRGDGFECQDIDECSERNNCSCDATCVNTDGSYQCICNNGFRGDGFECQDIDECSERNNCSCDATCVNTDGSYRCVCNNGFSGDGFECQDIDECVNSTNNCHERAICKNTRGSFTCTCCRGFIGDGVNCCRQRHYKHNTKYKSSKSKGTRHNRTKKKGTRHKRRKKTRKTSNQLTLDCGDQQVSSKSRKTRRTRKHKKSHRHSKS